MKIIREVLEGLHANPNIRKKCVPLFIGNPGIGKTKVVQAFAEEKNLKLVEIIGSTKMPNEISGIALPNRNTKLMEYFDFDQLLDLKDGDIIFFDELLNSNPMVLNAMLTILENRTMISGKKLPNVIFIAAANRQGATLTTPQIKERFIYYDISFNKSMWANYMYEKYQIIDPILDELIELIKGEKFLNGNDNYLTPRSIDKAITMMIAEIPTPYSAKLRHILSKLIENTTDQDIKINDYIWRKNEKLEWLKLKQLEFKI